MSGSSLMQYKLVEESQEWRAAPSSVLVGGAASAALDGDPREVHISEGVFLPFWLLGAPPGDFAALSPASLYSLSASHILSRQEAGKNLLNQL